MVADKIEILKAQLNKRLVLFGSILDRKKTRLKRQVELDRRINFMSIFFRRVYFPSKIGLLAHFILIELKN